MTVKELRDLLAKHPDDSTVLLKYWNYEYCESVFDDVIQVSDSQHLKAHAPLTILHGDSLVGRDSDTKQ